MFVITIQVLAANTITVEVPKILLKNVDFSVTFHGDFSIDEQFFLEHDGTEHYRQFQGVITTPDGSGALTVAVGGDLELSVHFLDDDGNEIEHSEEEGDDDHEDHEDGLEVDVADATVAHVEVEGHEEEGDDDGDDDHDHDHDEHGMAIHVEGVSEGSTTFTLMLMHDGHSDFTSLPVNVNVVAAE